MVTWAKIHPSKPEKKLNPTHASKSLLTPPPNSVQNVGNGITILGSMNSKQKGSQMLKMNKPAMKGNRNSFTDSQMWLVSRYCLVPQNFKLGDWGSSPC